MSAGRPFIDKAREQVDHELFDLLAVHASTALHCATLHAGTAVAG